ncbi:hypothetical protein SDC9_98373 [bioreactor metagenome]|uniref:Propanediol dehydratase n=1 Tax=bioreactor metagenome TaxID=1076179 RepID=A0A645AL96_9ZZZZ
MDQELMMKLIVEKVMEAMKAEGKPAASASCGGKMTAANYPLSEKSADKLQSPTGKKFTEMTKAGVLSGAISPDDMRISPETLEMQAQVAESVGRDAFASNMRRAAELIAVGDDRLLEIYNALRPYRSTKAELIAIAEELETKYGANISAGLVREAAATYEARGRLKKD